MSEVKSHGERAIELLQESVGRIHCLPTGWIDSRRALLDEVDRLKQAEDRDRELDRLHDDLRQKLDAYRKAGEAYRRAFQDRLDPPAYGPARHS